MVGGSPTEPGGRQTATGGRGFWGWTSHFDGEVAVFSGGLLWHRRSDSRPTVDGGAHGPAPGSPSADCARIVRDDEVQCPASHRRLRLAGSDGGTADAADAGAGQDRAAAGQGDDGEASKR